MFGADSSHFCSVDFLVSVRSIHFQVFQVDFLRLLPMGLQKASQCVLSQSIATISLATYFTVATAFAHWKMATLTSFLVRSLESRGCHHSNFSKANVNFNFDLETILVKGTWGDLDFHLKKLGAALYYYVLGRIQSCGPYLHRHLLKNSFAFF